MSRNEGDEANHDNNEVGSLLGSVGCDETSAKMILRTLAAPHLLACLRLYSVSLPLSKNARKTPLAANSRNGHELQHKFAIKYY